MVTLLEGAYHEVPGETLPPAEGDEISYSSYWGEYDAVMLCVLHVDTVTVPELRVEENPSIVTLLNTKQVPEEL